MAETSTDSKTIPVQVCHVQPDRQIILDIRVPEKTTLIEAIEKSGILDLLSRQIRENEVGIFGKKRPFDTELNAHDRIEIYRPLSTTPQETRRLRTSLKDR